MSNCKDPLTDCGCKNCTEPAPVMPRCDVPLIDGTYTHATVTVQGGCIINVASGSIPTFTIDECCEGGGGGGDCDCQDGADGRDGIDGITPNFSIGTVTLLNPTDYPTVSLSGTQTSPVLNFGLPSCDCSNSGGSGGCGGISDSDDYLTIDSGCITHVGPAWPPINSVEITSLTTGATFTGGYIDGTTWKLNADFSGLGIDSSRLDALENTVVQLASVVDNCCSGAGTGPGTGPGPGPNPPTQPQGTNALYPGHANPLLVNQVVQAAEIRWKPDGLWVAMGADAYNGALLGTRVGTWNPVAVQSSLYEIEFTGSGTGVTIPSGWQDLSNEVVISLTISSGSPTDSEFGGIAFEIRRKSDQVTFAIGIVSWAREL